MVGWGATVLMRKFGSTVGNGVSVGAEGVTVGVPGSNVGCERAKREEELVGVQGIG